MAPDTAASCPEGAAGDPNRKHSCWAKQTGRQHLRADSPWVGAAECVCSKLQP
jgi:hypothetical protein